MTKKHGLKLALLTTCLVWLVLYAVWKFRVEPQVFMMDRVAKFRTAGVILNVDASLKGSYPSDLEAIASAPPPPDNAASEYDHPDWSNYYYVAGISQADPDQLPILFDMPRHRGVTNVLVLFKVGGSSWVPTDVAQSLLTRPWDLSGWSTGFFAANGLHQTDEAISNLANRLHVLLPISQSK